MSRVLIFLAEGHEEVEAYTPVDLLRRAGIDIATVSITGSKVVTGSHKITTNADELIEEVDFDSAEMLILPGGMPGTKNLEACALLKEHVLAHAAKGGKLAAICAAPTVYGHWGLLEGRKACCFPGMEDGLVGAKVNKKEVTVDGNIITSRGMGTAIPFGLAIIEALTDKATADAVANKIVYKKSIF